MIFGMSNMESLIFALTVVASILTISVVGILFTFISMSRKGKAASGVHFKKGDIEDLLSNGSTNEARIAASAWKRGQPRNTTAYQLLAKAHFQLHEYVECKAVLDELITFAPEFEFSYRPYFERIEEELKKGRPRIVDSGDS
jgi:hypothetical protein